MKKIMYIARHGARIDSKNPTWRERAEFPHDPGLSPLGHEQANKLARYLCDKGIQKIYSSPYLRARQTAQPLSVMINVPVIVEDGLSEWLNPDWSSSRPALCESISLEHSLVRAVYPESDQMAWERAGKTAGMIASLETGPILIVTHAHSMCGAIFGLLGTRDLDVKCDYCSLAEIHMSKNGPTLVRNGDQSFLM